MRKQTFGGTKTTEQHTKEYDQLDIPMYHGWFQILPRFGHKNMVLCFQEGEQNMHRLQ